MSEKISILPIIKTHSSNIKNEISQLAQWCKQFAKLVCVC